MRTDIFDFDLPDDRIALRPAEPRDGARLMVVRPDGDIGHHVFSDLPRFLNPGDMMVMNDSRVVAARLQGRRPPRGADLPAVDIDITLHRRTAPGRFLAFAQPARRLRAGDRLQFSGGLDVAVVRRDGAEVELEFPLQGAELDAMIERVGAMPLPPYIAKQRAPDQRDARDYQTVYAVHPGSVAAPTAGLHFTPAVLESLKAAGVVLNSLTLHVGPGTFLPVSGEDTDQHVMHAEHARLEAATAARLNDCHGAGGRIAAVGTTSLRTLESAVDGIGRIAPIDRETDIFITPGYRFQAVDILLTNFHLPRSTLFMLVCAFMGTEVMQAAYAQAIREKYRFYSYGDACLLIRPR